MFEEVILLAFCSLVAVVGSTVVVWEAVSGRLFSLDGLSLTLISLTLTVIFGGNVAWSLHNGDVHRILDGFRKPPAENEAKEKSPKAA